MCELPWLSGKGSGVVFSLPCTVLDWLLSQSTICPIAESVEMDSCFFPRHLCKLNATDETRITMHPNIPYTGKMYCLYMGSLTFYNNQAFKVFYCFNLTITCKIYIASQRYLKNSFPYAFPFDDEPHFSWVNIWRNWDHSINLVPFKNFFGKVGNSQFCWMWRCTVLNEFSLNLGYDLYYFKTVLSKYLE